MKKRIVLIVIVVCVVSLIGAGVAIMVRRNSGPQLLKRARLNLEQTHKFDEAQRLAQKYVRSNPDDPQGHLLLGRALMHRGYWDDARRAFDTAYTLDRDNLDIPIHIANTWRFEARKPLTMPNADPETIRASCEGMRKALAVLNELTPADPDRLGLLSVKGHTHYDLAKIRMLLYARLEEQADLIADVKPGEARALRDEAQQVRTDGEEAFARARDNLRTAILEDPSRGHDAQALVMICERLKDDDTLAEIRPRIMGLEAPPPLAAMHLVRIGLDDARGKSESAYRKALPEACATLDKLIAGQTTRNERIELRIMRGRLALDNRNPREALAQAEKALALQEDRPEGQLVKALALFRQDKIEQAENDLFALQTRYPKNVEILFHYGRVAKAAGKLPLARTAFKKIIENHPDHPLTPLAYGHRAELDMAEGLRDEAFDNAMRHYSQRPDNPYALLALVRASMGTRNEAIVLNILPKAVQHAEGDLAMLNAAAKSFEVLGKRDTAGDLYERIAASQARTLDGRIARAQALVRLGRAPEAEKILHDELDIDPKNPRVHFELGKLFEETGRQFQSMEHFEKAFEHQPGNDDYRFELAESYLDSLQFERCERVLEEAPMGNARFGVVRVRLWIAQGKPLNMDQVRQWIGRGYRSSLAMAMVCLQNGRPEEAVGICTLMLKRGPGLSGPLSVLGRAHMAIAANAADEAERREHQTKSVEVLEKNLKRASGKPLPYFELARALGTTMTPDAIGRRLRELVDEPLPGQIDLTVGWAWSQVNRPDKAAEAFSRAASAPDVSGHIRGRANLLEAQALARAGQREEALEALDRASADSRWRDTALLSKADLLARMERDEEAVELLQELRSRCLQEKDDGGLRKVVARFNGMNRPDEALASADDLAEMTRNDARVHLLRAEAYALKVRDKDLDPKDRQALYDKIVEEFRHAIDKERGNYNTYIGLARIYDSRMERIEALDVLDELAGYNEAARAVALIEKGRLLMRWGLPDRAIEAYRQVLDLGFSEDARVQYALGQAFAALGRDDRARQLLDKVSPYVEFYLPARRMLIRLTERTEAKLEIVRKLRNRFPERQELFVEELRVLAEGDQPKKAARIASDWLDDRADPGAVSMPVAVSCLEIFLLAEAERPAIELCEKMARDNGHRVWRHVPLMMKVDDDPAAAARYLPPVEECDFYDAVLGLALAVKRDKPLDPWTTRLDTMLEKIAARPRQRAQSLNYRFLIALARGDTQRAASLLPEYARLGAVIREVAGEMADYGQNDPQAAAREAADYLVTAGAFEMGLRKFARGRAMAVLGDRPESQWAASLAMQHAGADELRETLESLQPDDCLLALTNRARLAFGEQDYETAAALYDRVADKLPEGVQSIGERLTRAMAHEYTGDKRKALAMYNAIWEESGNPVAMNNAAYLMTVLSPKDKEVLRKSLELVKEAIHKSPRSASFYDTLGWIKYRMGEIDEAAGLLRQAVIGMPRSPEVHYHLGVVEKAAGHKSLARWHLNATLEHARTSQRDGRKPTPSVAEVERQAREALNDLDEG